MSATSAAEQQHSDVRRHQKDTNAMYGVPLVAVLISGIALTGSIFLYCNSLQLQAEIDVLQAIVVGQQQTGGGSGGAGTDGIGGPQPKSDARLNRNNSRPGLLRRFTDMTSSLNEAVARINLWANFSSCLVGSDVIIG